jgi:hypothetical protein
MSCVRQYYLHMYSAPMPNVMHAACLTKITSIENVLSYVIFTTHHDQTRTCVCTQGGCPQVFYFMSLYFSMYRAPLVMII